MVVIVVGRKSIPYFVNIVYAQTKISFQKMNVDMKMYVNLDFKFFAHRSVKYLLVFSQILGNGRCNDFANNKECGYDGGDCCAQGSSFDYCSECECILADAGIYFFEIFDILYITVTDLANSCVTPLFRRPQGYQGCLEKRNYPLSSNLVVWCAKIGPKSKKV